MVNKTLTYSLTTPKMMYNFIKATEFHSEYNTTFYNFLTEELSQYSNYMHIESSINKLVFDDSGNCVVSVTIYYDSTIEELNNLCFAIDVYIHSSF